MANTYSFTKNIDINVDEENFSSEVIHVMISLRILDYFRFCSGTLAECEEYCQGDGTLRVDDSTWTNGAAQNNQPASDKTTKSSAPQGKKRNGSTRGKQHDKRAKVSIIQGESVPIQIFDDQNDQLNQNTNTRTTNSIDHSRTQRDQNEEISILRCDVAGKDNSSNRSIPSTSVPLISTNAVNTLVSNTNANRTVLTNRPQVNIIDRIQSAK